MERGDKMIYNREWDKMIEKRRRENNRGKRRGKMRQKNQKLKRDKWKQNLKLKGDSKIYCL